VFNVATGKQFTLLDLIGSINRTLGTTIEPEFAEPRRGDGRESRAGSSRAGDVLGFEPRVDFDEGLRRSIDYYLSLA
ncbi:MAG: LPS biosynthesis protein WbpP, partial [Planctomycetota bacterium]